MSRFIDIDTQLGFKNLSVYCSIIYDIELYSVHLNKLSAASVLATQKLIRGIHPRLTLFDTTLPLPYLQVIENQKQVAYQ